MQNIHQLGENEDTLVKVIEQGKKLGFEKEFTFDKKRFILEGQYYKPEDLSIEFQRRFEGMTNPADEMIYFRISTNDGRMGYYTTGYGVYGNDAALNFLKNVVHVNTV